MRAPHLFLVGGTWHYRFQKDGRRIQRSTKETIRAKAEAIAWAAFTGERPMPTLSELTEMWLMAHETTASRAHQRAVEIFGRLHLYSLAEVRIDRIRTEDVEAARDRHLEGRAPATLALWLRILKLLSNWAVERELIERVPWKVKMPKLQKRPRVILPLDKTRAWLAAVDEATRRRPAVATAIRMMLFLGLREAEALSAQWQWIDWERRTYTPGRTKGREADPLPVPQHLIAHLAPARAPSGLIAPNPDGREYASGATRGAIVRANAAVGTPGVSPHRLRGSCCTHLSEAGVPVQDLQRFMRHKDAKTTMGYLEVDLSRAARGLEAVAEKWRGSGENCGIGVHERPVGDYR